MYLNNCSENSRTRIYCCHKPVQLCWFQYCYQGIHRRETSVHVHYQWIVLKVLTRSTLYCLITVQHVWAVKDKCHLENKQSISDNALQCAAYSVTEPTERCQSAHKQAAWRKHRELPLARKIFSLKCTDGIFRLEDGFNKCIFCTSAENYC